MKAVKRSSGEPPREGRADVVLAIRVHPGARKSEVVGFHGDALKIRLAAPPVDGRANDELLRFLAEAFGVPRANVALLRGASSRSKLVRIEAPAGYPVGWPRSGTVSG